MYGYTNEGYIPAGYGQMGYGQPGFGQQCQMPRVTKSMILENIRMGVASISGVMVTREEKLDDAPSVLRHCCAEAGGISYLMPIPYMVPGSGMQIGVYFCARCGKLYYPREIPV